MTSSAPTVALLGPSGQLGAPLLSNLSALHEASRLKLVVLHRPGSKFAALPAGADDRILDVNSATPNDVVEALNAVDILIDATSQTTPEASQTLLAALPRTSLKAFIPSDYSIPWSAAERQHAPNVLVTSKTAFNDQARAAHIPLVTIANGLFEPILAVAQVSGIDVASNALSLYGRAREVRAPVTSPAYLAAAIAQVVVLPQLESNYTVIEYWVSGQEVAEALEAVNGAKPVVTQFTDEEAAGAEASGVLGALSVAFRKKWGGDGFHPEEVLFEPAGVAKGDILATLKKAKAA